MNCFRSCGCRSCRQVNRYAKKVAKRWAHRALRRHGKVDIVQNKEIVREVVACGRPG